MINFLIRNKNGLLFLILQLIAFTFIYNSVSYPRSTIFNSSMYFVGSIQEGYHNLQEYANLRKTNEQLADENARLRSLMKSSYFEKFVISDTIVDTLYTQQYEFISAQVINSSFTYLNNYITINRGSNHGIRKGMGIINSQGVIGKIQNVSKNFATAIPLIHTRGNITGRIQTSKHFGTVSWDGKDYQHVQLNKIPRQANFSIGDTVVSDIRSQIFPSGIPIGVIEDKQLNMETQFLNLNIKLIPDFTNLEYVYVIRDLLKGERLEFETTTQIEE